MMRVLVTRPQGDAEQTVQALAVRGHEAVLAPVLNIAPTGEPLPSGTFDAVLLTSANAAPALASLGAAFETLPIFAVGERTASAAAALPRDVRAAEGNAASLAGLVARTMEPGARLLYIAGVNRKPDLETMLSARGFLVATWVAYEAVAAERLPEAGQMALRDGQLDTALHYSRRSADVVLRLVNDAGLTARLLDLPHVCISADAAAPLRAAGARFVTIAPRPDEMSLLTALDESAKYARGRSRATPSR